MRYINKTVVVTGGAQGIGRGICEAYAAEGAKVIIGDLEEEAGLELEGMLRALGFKATFIHLDVAVEEEVTQAVQRTISLYGGIDILVNNAGIGAGGTLTDRSMEAWDRVLAVNLKGPYMMAKYCAPYLSEGEQGNIINIVSTRALMSEADTEPYSASKGGLLALTHSLAVSLGPSIRVNAISPGWIEVSEHQKQSRRRQPVHSPEDLSQHPAGRVGKPEDIARTCLFLTSPDAGFITGINIVVDGGMTVKMIYV